MEKFIKPQHEILIWFFVLLAMIIPEWWLFFMSPEERYQRGLQGFDFYIAMIQPFLAIPVIMRFSRLLPVWGITRPWVITLIRRGLYIYFFKLLVLFFVVIVFEIGH